MDKKIDKAAEAKENQTEKREEDKKLPDEELDKVSGGFQVPRDPNAIFDQSKYPTT